MFGRTQRHPDLPTLAADIEYIAAAVAWLVENQEATMPTLQQIVDEIVQARSVLHAVEELLKNFKAAVEDARTADSPDAKLAELSQMIEDGHKEIANAFQQLESHEQHAQDAAQTGIDPNEPTERLIPAEEVEEADDDEPEHPDKPKRRKRK